MRPSRAWMRFLEQGRGDCGLTDPDAFCSGEVCGTHGGRPTCGCCDVIYSRGHKEVRAGRETKRRWCLVSGTQSDSLLPTLLRPCARHNLRAREQRFESSPSARHTTHRNQGERSPTRHIVSSERDVHLFTVAKTEHHYL